MGNIHIKDSYRISRHSFRAVLDLRESNAKAKGDTNELEVFGNRSKFSLMMEWAAHNFCYALGIARARTSDADLNYPQKWYARIGYTVAGILVWLFIR